MSKIRVRSIRYHRIVNSLCLLALLGSLLFLILNWSSIPEQIPGHFSISGEIDRWVNKIQLVVLYFVGVLIYIGLSMIERFPSIWNTGVTITAANQERIYHILKSMIVTLKLIVVVIFMFLLIYSTLLIDLPSGFTFVSLGVLFGTIIFYGIRVILSR